MVRTASFMRRSVLTVRTYPLRHQRKTEWVLIKDGDDLHLRRSLLTRRNRAGTRSVAKSGGRRQIQSGTRVTIGLHFHMNDCENGTREHQIGWIPGGAWVVSLMEPVTLLTHEILAVEPSGKLAVVWGSLKQ